MGREEDRERDATGDGDKEKQVRCLGPLSGQPSESCMPPPPQNKVGGVPEVPFRAPKTKAKLDLRRWSTQIQTSQAFSHSENLTLLSPWPWDLGYQTGRVLR